MNNDTRVEMGTIVAWADITNDGRVIIYPEGCREEIEATMASREAFQVIFKHGVPWTITRADGNGVYKVATERRIDKDYDLLHDATPLQITPDEEEALIEFLAEELDYPYKKAVTKEAPSDSSLDQLIEITRECDRTASRILRAKTTKEKRGTLLAPVRAWVGKLIESTKGDEVRCVVCGKILARKDALIGAINHEWQCKDCYEAEDKHCYMCHITA